MKFGWGSDHCPGDHQQRLKKYLGNLDLGIRKSYLKCQMCHGQGLHTYVCLGLVGLHNNNKKRSHTQLDSRKQVIAFQDRVITINIKEAQHPLK